MNMTLSMTDIRSMAGPDLVALHRFIAGEIRRLCTGQAGDADQLRQLERTARDVDSEIARWPGLSARAALA